MDTIQRFLRRMYLEKNLELFLRESKYHRSFDEDEDLEGIVLWEWDAEVGQSGDSI